MADVMKIILAEPDSDTRKAVLMELIARREPAEVLMLTGISVLSEDDEIRAIALDALASRGTGRRAGSLLTSWRRDGSLLAVAGAMTGEQRLRASEVMGELLLREQQHLART